MYKSTVMEYFLKFVKSKSLLNWIIATSFIIIYLIFFNRILLNPISLKHIVVSKFEFIDTLKIEENAYYKNFLQENFNNIPHSWVSMTDSMINASNKTMKNIGSLDKSRILLKNLTLNHSRGEGVFANVVETYDSIKNNKGVCSDYAKVYTGLLNAAKIKNRQWLMLFDSYSDGHTFVEIYDEKYNKWILIDPYFAVLLKDKKSNNYLSLFQLREKLKKEEYDSYTIERLDTTYNNRFLNSATNFSFYYIKGITKLVLRNGNNVFGTFRNNKILGIKVHIGIRQLLGYLLNEYPSEIIVTNDFDKTAMQNLYFERRIVAFFFILQLTWLYNTINIIYKVKKGTMV